MSAMTDACRLLDDAVATQPSPPAEYRREDLIGAMHAVISARPDPEAERTLLAILRFEGTIRPAEGSEGPHGMPPEDMLKSLAVQALARWTGSAYLGEMRRVEATTSSSALRSIVQHVIRQIDREPLL
jgi:hypothetical protein